MKTVILDGFTANPGDLSWSELEKLGELVVYDRTKPEETVARAADAEIVLTNKVIISHEVMAQLPKLKYIGVLATGYNVVDIEEAHKRGIIVTNVPAYSTDSVAQLTIAHLLNICWQPQHYTDEAHDLKWTNCGSYAYFNTPLIELAGKQMGIVGLGNIGSAVARIALAMNMRVMAYTSKSQDQLPEGIIKADNLEHLLRTSDVLTMHCPLNAQTTGMINAEGLAMMKQGSIVLNMARGALIVEQDLADALNSGHLYASAIDCTSVEPPAADHPLLTARNCYITPHIGWTSFEARERLMDVITSNVAAYLDGKPVNVVN